ncbi:hypothetical protein [Fimbriiglobus ruber]|uniref:hypothetical protein n=1 Tax=Fimbriiglobus ruber TaxID=1908690 RepID=UPI000B4B522B|nr:hypothetical protein [Fimbriiglobus ruber]
MNHDRLREMIDRDIQGPFIGRWDGDGSPAPSGNNVVHVVLCDGGCGQFVPASDPEPVAVYYCLNCGVKRRESDVLSVFSRHRGIGLQISQVTRFLNTDGPCPWCPVVAQVRRPAAVPEKSRERVKRVVARLVAAGKIRRLEVGRVPMYLLGETNE